jgi:predicted ester cyclase
VIRQLRRRQLAAGKSITYKEIFIFRFVNDRIAEARGVVDVFSQMQQLGAIPGG